MKSGFLKLSNVKERKCILTISSQVNSTYFVKFSKHNSASFTLSKHIKGH